MVDILENSGKRRDNNYHVIILKNSFNDIILLFF